MAKQTIEIGSAANDGTGDTLRNAFNKTNENFTEVYDNIAGNVVTIGIYINAAAASPLLVLTNHPNSEQPLVNGAFAYINFDASKFTSMRLFGRVGAASTSVNNPRVYPQYTTDLTGASGWTTIGTGTVASNEALSLAGVGQVKTNWITLPAGAKADVLFRIAQNGGDGDKDPSFVNLYIQFKM